jgi:coproporphyrinogen III oxidase
MQMYQENCSTPAVSVFVFVVIVSDAKETQSPMVPTFRSDVQIFLVCKNSKTGEQQQKNNNSSNKGDAIAWFGVGAGLTPYYIFEEDIRSFHQTYRNVYEPAEKVAAIAERLIFGILFTL